ncbi:hypothetical protein NQZ68_027990 [Dissostichus eleginoides]|nr:hypothetical protein NQZ68_027990 [Dissostichus eleginoides]
MRAPSSANNDFSIPGGQVVALAVIPLYTGLPPANKHQRKSRGHVKLVAQPDGVFSAPHICRTAATKRHI